MDLIQDANTGLCQAADAFDHTRGSFASCAGFYIRAAIRARLTDDFGNRLHGRSLPPRRVSYMEDYEGFDQASDAPGPEDEAHFYAVLESSMAQLTE